MGHQNGDALIFRVTNENSAVGFAWIEADLLQDVAEGLVLAAFTLLETVDCLF
jgi:hypothetical protein